MIGGNIDEKKLKEIGEKGVTSMICDSTNVFSPGRAGSELEVRESLIKIMETKSQQNFSNFICIECSPYGVNFLLC